MGIHLVISDPQADGLPDGYAGVCEVARILSDLVLKRLEPRNTNPNAPVYLGVTFPEELGDTPLFRHINTSGNPKLTSPEQREHALDRVAERLDNLEQHPHHTLSWKDRTESTPERVGRWGRGLRTSHRCWAMSGLTEPYNDAVLLVMAVHCEELTHLEAYAKARRDSNPYYIELLRLWWEHLVQKKEGEIEAAISAAEAPNV